MEIRRFATKKTRRNEVIMEKLIIIGSGPAGLTAAVYASRAGLKPLVVTGKQPGGLLTQTGEVENFPGFPDGIDGYELMSLMRRQAERFETKFLSGTVTKTDLKNAGPQTVELADGTILETQALILATGSDPRWLGLESEQRLIGRGVSACATCDGAFYRGQTVAVIGGGDTAMQEALELTKFASEVHVVHRRNVLRATKIMAERAANHPKITFHWNETVSEVLGKDAVTGIRLRNTVTGRETILECAACFVALGHVPGTAFLPKEIELTDGGCISLRHPGSATSIDGVFAAGDCADCLYRQAITAAGMGCRAAIDVAKWLEEH